MTEYTMNSIKIREISNGLVLENVNDFNAKHIFDCGQSFRWNKEGDNSYTGVAFNKVINISSDSDDKKVTILNTSLKDFEGIWFKYLDLNRNYRDIKRKLSSDSIMKNAIKYGSGIRILNQDPWEILISFIISANNRIPMISKSINLLSEMYGQPISYNGKTYYSFPTPEGIGSAGISDIEKCRAGFRCKYIKKAAEMVKSGEIDLKDIKEMETHRAREELKRIPGVGAKVADCILLFSMEKHEVYPVDVWVKRVTEHLFLKKETKVNEIHDYAKGRFGNLAGFAQEYLFYYARELKIGKN